MTNQRPYVVNLREEGYTLYIGRPSKWGNPFRIGRDGTRKEVLRKYETYIRSRPDLIAALPELREHVLGCFCHPLPCHGDILIKLLHEYFPLEKGSTK